MSTPQSKLFQFHAVFGKFWQNRMLVPPPSPEGWRSNLGEIMEPPLLIVHDITIRTLYLFSSCLLVFHYSLVHFYLKPSDQTKIIRVFTFASRNCPKISKKESSAHVSANYYLTKKWHLEHVYWFY